MEEESLEKHSLSLGESKGGLARLLHAPQLRFSEFSSRFPGWLLGAHGPSPLSPRHGKGCQGEQEDGVGDIRALHMPWNPLAVH